MRTLPLRLSPVDGGSLLGYIARYSHTFQFQPGDVVSALGLDPGAGSVAAAARLCRYVGRAFGRALIAASAALANAVQGHQVWIWCSRFCPPCLREDGVWRLAWQLGWSAVCVRH